MSDLQPIFCKSSVFQSNFLQGVKFGVNFFTDPQILNRKLYNASPFKVTLSPENQVLLDGFLSKKLCFWVVLHHWNVKVNFFALSWKSWFRDEQFGKKHILKQILWEESNSITFLKLIKFSNTLLQHVSLSIKPFTTRQILSPIFHKADDFEVKMFLGDQYLMEIFNSKKSFFGYFTP